MASPMRLPPAVTSTRKPLIPRSMRWLREMWFGKCQPAGRELSFERGRSCNAALLCGGNPERGIDNGLFFCNSNFDRRPRQAAPTRPGGRNMEEQNRNVAVVGTGLVGRAWAAIFARAGWNVRLTDPHAPTLKAAPGLIRDEL